jgi:hypothetical protein
LDDVILIQPAAGNASDSFETNAGAIFSWGSRLFLFLKRVYAVADQLNAAMQIASSTDATVHTQLAPIELLPV